MYLLSAFQAKMLLALSTVPFLFSIYKLIIFQMWFRKLHRHWHMQLSSSMQKSTAHFSQLQLNSTTILTCEICQTYFKLVELFVSYCKKVMLLITRECCSQHPIVRKFLQIWFDFGSMRLQECMVINSLMTRFIC